MKNKNIPIDFTIDHTSVTEGDVVELQWNAPNAEAVQLVLDNGVKSSRMEVSVTGSKKFRLNRSGKTKLILEVTANGNVIRRKLAVKVNKMRPVKAHVVDDRGNRVKPLAQLNEKWKTFRSRLRYSWGLLPEKKQFAYKILGLIAVSMLLGALSPKLAPLGLFLVVAYLAWTILKR